MRNIIFPTQVDYSNKGNKGQVFLYPNMDILPIPLIPLIVQSQGRLITFSQRASDDYHPHSLPSK